MAIPSLAMIPELGRQMMQTGSNPTPLDAMYQRKTERAKIEMEKKYKEAMAEKALWEIQSEKDALAREAAMKEMVASKWQELTSQQGAPAGGAGPMGTGGPTMRTLGGPSSYGGGGLQGIGQSSPMMQMGDAMMGSGELGAAKEFYNTATTRQSIIGNQRNQQQDDQQQRGLAAYALFMKGASPEQVKQITGFSSQTEAAAVVPDELLKDMRAAQEEARIRSRPDKPKGPRSLSSFIDEDKDLNSFFNVNLLEHFDIPMEVDDDGNPTNVDSTSFFPETKNYMYEAYKMRAKKFEAGAPGIKAGEDPTSAAWREVNSSFELLEYAPWMGYNRKALVPKDFIKEVQAAHPSVTEGDIVEAYLKEIGVEY